MRIGALLAAALFAAMAPAAAAEPDRDGFLLATLLGIDRSSLFAEGTYTPEAEHQAFATIYADAKTAAEKPDDDEAVVRFLFAGWLAERRGEPALATAFAGDFKALFDARTDDLLGAMALLPFAVPDLCARLGAGFADADRANAYAAIGTRIQELLGPVDGARCTLAFLGARP